MEARPSSPDLNPRNSRTVHGDYIAEVVVDDTTSTEVFHWFVRNRTTFEVIILGETTSHESALHEAEDHLSRLSERDGRGEVPGLRRSAGA